jgi:hypothetical protein
LKSEQDEKEVHTFLWKYFTRENDQTLLTMPEIRISKNPVVDVGAVFRHLFVQFMNTELSSSWYERNDSHIVFAAQGVIADSDHTLKHY